MLLKIRQVVLDPKLRLFIIGGALSALIDIITMQSLLWCGVSLIFSTSIGFAFGLIFNYFFHKVVTFSHEGSHYVVWKYIAVVGINYFITLLCVGLSKIYLGFPLYGKIVSLFIVGLNGYILSKYWIFK